MNQPPRMQIDSIARHDLDETFVDSFTSINFDGSAWRIEFCVTRMDQPIPPNTLKGKRVPVCRLVLSPNAGLELSVKLQSVVNEMEKRGVIKKNPIITPPTSSTAN